MVVLSALGDQRKSFNFKLKAGKFQVRGAKPNFYAYDVVLHDL